MGAILIPSNRIFNIKNDKILDNVIDKVEIEVGTPTLKVQNNFNIETVEKKQNDFKIKAYFYDADGNLTGGTTEYQKLVNSNDNIGDTITSFYNGNLRVRSYCAMTGFGFIPIKLVIPYVSKERTVPYPISELDVSYSMSCKTNTYEVTVSTGGKPLETTSTGLILSFGKKISSSYVSSQPTETTYTYTAQTWGNGVETATSTAKIIVANSIKLEDGGTYTSPYSPTIGVAAASDGTKLFTVEFYIPYYSQIVHAGYDELVSNITGTTSMSGTSTDYIPYSITITVQGKAYTLDIPTETKSYGSGDNIYSIPNNELIQASNIYATADDDTTDEQIELLCTNILDEYANGKEKAVIECAVSTYYDEENNKVIDPYSSDKKTLFKIGDEVIPLVFKPKSSTIEPLSKYSDGTNKVFKVVGSKVEYKGAPFQTLTLQEVKQKSN